MRPFAALLTSIALSYNGQTPVGSLHYGPDVPKPFIAPLRAPDGRVVTRRFPMETVAGESQDHPHHRGFFVGYGEINGTDFWANEVHQPASKLARGKLVTVGEPQQLSHPQAVALNVEWRGADGHVILKEARTLSFPGSGIVDLRMHFTAAVDAHFADTKEGFVAIRLADSMTEKNGGGRLHDAEGRSGEAQVWGKRAAWAAYEGQVDSKPVTVEIFDHPSNHGFPARWHARAYGLFALNPFSQNAYDPSAAKTEFVLHRGETLQLKYRLAIVPGAFDPAQARREAKEFAASTAPGEASSD